MIILGIDPGLASTGFGLVKEKKSSSGHLPIELLSFGCIKTPSNESTSKRLILIFRQVKEIINKCKPDIMAVEDVFSMKNTIFIGHLTCCLFIAVSMN